MQRRRSNTKAQRNRIQSFYSIKIIEPLVLSLNAFLCDTNPSADNAVNALKPIVWKEKIFFYSAYTGSKGFTQQQVHTANATGFGAAADDYAERGIDLNEQLVKNKPATFFMRVNSDAMIGAGIHPGDVVIVDRSLEAKSGKVVIATVDGELLIRRLEINGNKKKLVPATRKLSPIDVDGSLQVWGVVTYVIHNL